MAGLSTLTEMPTAITAGDTLLVLISSSDYPAPDWYLEYNARTTEPNEGGGSPIDLTSTASGQNHFFSVSNETTATWLAGDYIITARATYTVGTTMAATFWSGRLTVLPEVKSQPSNFDGRTFEARIRDKLKIVLDGKATRDVLNTSIAGVQIGRMSLEEVRKAYEDFDVKVQVQEAKLRADQGKGQYSNIGIIWVRP